MKRKRLLTLLGFILIVVTLSFTAACTKTAAPEETFEPVELSIATSVPPTDPLVTVMFESWAKEIEQNTNGMVKFKTYPSATLLKTADAYRGVVDGAADCTGAWLHSNMPGRFPLFEVIDLPLLIPSLEVGTRVINELYQKFPEMQAEHDDLHLLALTSSSCVELHTAKKQIVTIDDIQGMKMGGGKGGTANAELVGAVPVPMPPTEFYGSLEKGVVDGLAISWPVVHSFKVEDVLEYHTEAHLGSNSMCNVLNLDTWNSFPQDIQQIVDEASAKLPDLYAQAIGINHDNAIKGANDLGHPITSLTATERAGWVELAKPSWDEWAAAMEAEGLPGQAVLDETIRLVEKYSE